MGSSPVQYATEIVVGGGGGGGGADMMLSEQAVSTARRRMASGFMDVRSLGSRAESVVQGIALGVIVAAIVGVAGVLLASTLLGLMGASDSVIATGKTYPRVMLGGNVVILLLCLVNAIFRGAGAAAIAMRVLWLANWINIILGPLLIFGIGPFPRLGVTGAAIATTIGRATGVLYQLYRLWRRDGRVGIHRYQVALKPAVMQTLLRLSGTGTFQVFVGMASWIGLTRINASFGTDALAGYQIA